MAGFKMKLLINYMCTCGGKKLVGHSTILLGIQSNEKGSLQPCRAESKKDKLQSMINIKIGSYTNRCI